MKSFKQFMTEVLTQSQKAEVDTWPKGDNSFSNSAFNSPSEQRISIPLEHHDSEHRKAVEDHLGAHGYTIKDYNAGKATDKYGREVNIGRALNKTKGEGLIQGFNNDPARQQKKTSADSSGFRVSITRHPHDVAGMTSSGQSWENKSCMNFETGGNRRYLPQDIIHGTHVAYLTHEDDKENEHPLARIVLKKHFNIDNPHDEILLPEDRTYGDSPAAFAHTVNKWANDNFPVKRDAIYRKHPDVYDDTRQPYYMHKDAIDRALGHHDAEVRRSAASHQEINEDQLHKALSDDDWKVRAAAASNHNANLTHLDRAINDHKEPSSFNVRAAVAGNRNVTKAHLDKIFGLGGHTADESADVRSAAAGNHTAHETHLDAALGDESEDVREAAAGNHNITDEQLKRAFAGSSIKVRAAAARNHKATKEQLDAALKERAWRIRIGAASNANLTKEQHEAALKDKDRVVRKAAVNNVNYRKHFGTATESIDRGLSHPNVDSRINAASRSDINDRQLHTALDDDNAKVRAIAAAHKNATREHLLKAMGDKDESVKKAAINNPNYTQHFRVSSSPSDRRGETREHSKAYLDSFDMDD